MSLPRTQFRSIALLAAALLVTLPAPAKAAEDCADLLLSMRERAREGFPAPFKVRFRLWSPPEMTVSRAADELDAIRDYPDHPDRARLTRALTRASSAGWSDPQTIWYFGPDRHRNSMANRHGDETVELDVATNGPLNWSLSNSTLGLSDSDEHPSGTPHVLRTTLGLLAYAGLYPNSENIRLLRCDRAGDAWSAVWRTQRAEIEVAGTVRPDGTLRTERRVLLRTFPEPGDAVGTVTEYTGFVRSEVFGRDVPTLMTMTGPDGAVTRRLEILELTAIDPGDADELLRVPEPGATDPVRGEVAFRHVNDRRAGGGGLLIQTRTGWEAPLNAPAKPPASGPAWRSPYALAGVCVLSLVLIGWWLRARSAR